jgi:hypothetical protein
MDMTGKPPEVGGIREQPVGRQVNVISGSLLADLSWPR